MVLFPNRFRERNRLVSTGGQAYSVLGPPIGDYPQGDIYAYQRMWDVVGFPNEDNYLVAENRDVSGWANGRVSHYYRCRNWAIADTFYSWSIPGFGGLPSTNDAALQVLARTNPGLPTVDLPLFAFELKDIPRMIRHVGSRIKDIRHLMRKGLSPKLLADDYLALQFGWTPLLSDLRKIVDLVGNVDQRLNHLNRLYSGGGLARTNTTYEESADIGPQGHYIGPPYSNETALEIRYEARVKQWGSLKYYPTSPPGWKSDNEKLTYARSLAFGAGLRPSSLWNAMPWTWLIDWFSSLGDYIAANDNTVPVTLSHFSIMEYRGIFAVDHSFYPGYNPYGASFVLNGKPVYEMKLRSPIISPPSPSFHLPMLSGKQLSILSALAIQKFGK